MQGVIVDSCDEMNTYQAMDTGEYETTNVL